MATKPMAAHSDVFLIDHAWTFQYQQALDTLMGSPALIERLENISEYAEKREIETAEKSTKTAE